MTDLHEGRGPKLDRLAKAFAAIAILAFSASFFTEGLGGPDGLRNGLKWLSLAAALASGWRTAAQVRRGRALRNRGPASR